MTFKFNEQRKKVGDFTLEKQLGTKPAWTRDPDTGSSDAQAHRPLDG